MHNNKIEKRISTDYPLASRLPTSDTIRPMANAPKLLAISSSNPRPELTRNPPATPPIIPDTAFNHQGSGFGSGGILGGIVPHQPIKDQYITNATTEKKLS